MKGFCIYLPGNSISVQGWSEFVVSSRIWKSPLKIKGWPALSPVVVDEFLKENGLRWTYPLEGEKEIDGLRCTAYKTKNHWGRVGCFLSHYLLWKECVRLGEAIAVFEDDALFTRDFHPVELEDAFRRGYGMISLNDPRGATRLASVYHKELQKKVVENPLDLVAPVPIIDGLETPQGLPGNSAYVIQPWFAQKLIDKVDEVGAMPNDALANRRWFLGALGCLVNYATKVSGRPSTLA